MLICKIADYTLILLQYTVTMKHLYLYCALLLTGWTFAQTPRLVLYEEFTGENCPPCASTNPALNALLALPTNTPKVQSIKWQVPIPSAPSNTWSLYKTNMAEIDWRWKSIANGGYGYTPAINSAPSSKIDGQEATVFGAASGHPANLNSNVIATAQSYTSAFAVTMNRAWDPSGNAITLTVNIQATANFNAVGNLVFRTVMIERVIDFSVAPGTNGEKHFEDIAIKSFPTLQSGVAMTSNWSIGQTQTFTLNCAIPSYCRKKEEIAFVGFIQDDGNQRVAQCVRADRQPLLYDALALAAKIDPVCSASLSPLVYVKNNGLNAITAMTITPYIDGTAASPFTWTGNLAAGSNASITLAPITSPTLSGAHSFSYQITALNASDFNLSNNSARVSFLVANAYAAGPVSEGFSAVAFPPVNGFVVVNTNAGPSWSRVTNAGGFNLSMQSAKYDFYNNTVAGDVDEFYLPPVDLSGGNPPQLLFDIAYAQRNANSNDKLDIMASSDCGTTWTNVFSQTGAMMTNIAPVSGSAYVPDVNDPTHWRNELVTLTGFNKSSVLIKFVTTNGNGNNLFIDNINLEQTSPTAVRALNSVDQLQMFPNPASSQVNIEFSNSSKEPVQVYISDVTGKRVWSKEMVSDSKRIELQPELPAGTYLIQIERADSKWVKSLIIKP